MIQRVTDVVHLNLSLAMHAPAAVCSAAGSCWPYGVLSPLFASLSAAAAPCSSIHSSSSTFSHARSASNQAPLMRMQQQQQDQQGSSHSSRSPWVKLLAGGAAAAAAAAAGWAVWSENDAEMRAQALAEESSRAGLSRCSGATQVRGRARSSVLSRTHNISWYK